MLSVLAAALLLLPGAAVAQGALTLTKSGMGPEADYTMAGQTLNYTFAVENTGTGPLTGPVTIADDLATDESCPDVTTVGNTDGNLDPGETIVCTASYMTTAGDVTSGFVTNCATASADGETSNEDCETLAVDLGILVDLVMCQDGSGSISADDWDLQLAGVHAGLDNALIPDHLNGSIRLTIVVFSGDASVEVGPTIIDSQATLDSFTADVEALTQPEGSTDIAECITVAHSVLCPGGDLGRGECADNGVHRVIDISTDGDPTTENCPDTGDDQLCAITRSNEAENDGVNVLNVIGVGPGPTESNMVDWAFPEPVDVFDTAAMEFPSEGDEGFVVLVDTFSDYEPAIFAKISAELAAEMAATKTVTNTGSGAGGAFQAGDTINYTIEVTNNGAVTLDNVVVSDPLLGLTNESCAVTLASMASCQVMGSYIVTQADIDDNGGGDGDIDNIATANSDQTGPQEASAEAQLVTQDPSFAVDKTVTNTGSGAGGSFQAGDTVMYTIDVTNDGNVTLDNVVVSDPLLGLVNAVCAASLAPAASCQVMGTYMVTQADIDNNGGGDGDIDNTATADSDQTGSQTASAEAQLVTQDASISMTKTVTNMGTGPGGNFQAGDTINYTIVVTNNGNVTLTTIVVSDPLLGLTNEPCAATLAPAATCQVMGSYVVTQNDIDTNGGGDGDIDNTATGDSDQTSPQTASAEAPLAVVPDMTTTKTVTNTGSGPGGTFQAGDTINYTIDVTNDGTVTLDNVVVSDPLLGLTNESCAVTLAPAASCQVMGTYTVTQADIDDNGGGDGDIDNTATANSDTTGPESAEAEAQLVGQDPSFAVDKTVTNTGTGAGGAFQAGDTVEYTIVVTNDGNVTLTNVVVSDPLLSLTNAMCSASLAPAATCQVMGSYVVTQGDIDDNGGGDGDIDNTATADSDQTGSQTANAEAQLVTQDASIALTKTVTNSGTGAGGAFQAGDPINYTIEVTNDGNVTLDNVVVSDPRLVLTNEPCAATLAPAATCQVMGSYVVTQDDIDTNGGGDGDIDNTATANSDQAGPQTANAEAQLVAQNPDITLVKTADPVEYSAVGDVINYTFDVTNSGNITLYDVIVSDPLIEGPPNNGTISCPGGNPIPTMAPGASVSCSGSYTITQADLDAGSVSNTATAEGCSVERGSVGGDCPGVTAMDDADAVIERELLDVSFRVTKDFSDDNPAGVTVTIECNTGLPLQQSAVIHDPDAAGLGPGDFTHVDFVVVDFEPGTMDCDIFEAVPAGYLPDYTAAAGQDGAAGNIFDDEDGCHYEDVEAGQFLCEIFNELQPVDVVVEKEWIDENPEFLLQRTVHVTLECDGPILGGFDCGGGNTCRDAFIDPDNPGEFQVLPHFNGTECSATERPRPIVLIDESDCEELLLFPGQGDSCVIVNTRLFAGIPTLSQYGLLLMALLMLGFGAVAYRRFI